MYPAKPFYLRDDPGKRKLPGPCLATIHISRAERRWPSGRRRNWPTALDVPPAGAGHRGLLRRKLADRGPAVGGGRAAAPSRPGRCRQSPASRAREVERSTRRGRAPSASASPALVAVSGACGERAGLTGEPVGVRDPAFTNGRSVVLDVIQNRHEGFRSDVQPRQAHRKDSSS